MLSVDQALPFVRHDDPLVVDLAMHYLERVRWPQRLSGQFVLDAVREGGREKLNRWLSHFEPSSEVLRYAIAAIREGNVGREEFWPCGVIAEADDALFTPEVVAQVTSLDLGLDWVRKRTRRRLEMMNWPTDRLQARFLKACEEANGTGKAQSELHEIFALVDRLAQRPEADDWAVQQLEQFYGEGWWTEIFLFSLLAQGGRRADNVLPRAIDRFLEVQWEENESLAGETAGAIGALARERDLPALASLWEQSGDDQRTEVAETIGHLRVPGADELLLRCARESDDQDARTLAAIGLCEMLTDVPDAIEFVRDLTDREDFAPDHCDLEELAIPLGIILGRPFAEQAAWRGRIGEGGSQAESRRRLWDQKYPQFAKLGELVNQMAEKKREAQALRLENARLREEIGRLGGPAAQAVSSSDRKVGRNDPCPCGSGKKYKKCCLAKDQE